MRGAGGRDGSRRRFAPWLGASLGLLLLAARADRPAAQVTGGAVEGRVVDAAGAPLQARAVLTGLAIQGRRLSVTDARGAFRFDGIPVGACEIAITALGRQPRTISGIEVGLGRDTDLGAIRLEVEAIPVAGVTVTTARASPDRRSTAIGGRISKQELRALPTDRDYLSNAALLPQADLSYFGDRLNLAGTTGPETDFYVDGVRLNEPPGNAVSTSLPANVVQEIRVEAGGYEAEYGGAGGGIVHAVTATGGNDFHGQAFGFFADHALTVASGGPAVSPFSSSDRSWDAGASAGFPLRRDRLWLFLAWNPTFEREAIALPGFPVLEDTRRAQRFATKMRWRAADATSVVLSVLGDPSTRDQVGGIALNQLQSLASLDPVTSERRGGGWGGSVEIHQGLSARAALELRGALTRSDYSEQPVTARGRTEPLYVDETGFVDGGLGRLVDREAGRSSAGAALSARWNAHSLKAGVAYEDAFFEEDLTLDRLTRNSPTDYQLVTLTGRRSSNHTRVPAAYVQDAWSATDRWRVSLGLRWATEHWVTSGGDVGQRLEDAWQPRLGISWQPERSGRSLVFASAGRFFQQTRLNVPGFSMQDVSSTYLVRNFNHDPRVDPSGGVVTGLLRLGRQAEVDGLRGACFDEAQLGLERTFGAARLGARALLREQRDGIVGVFDPATMTLVFGNPGHGALAPYPEIERRYRSLELTASTPDLAGVAAGASYVWSSSRGNYEGYWDQSAGDNDPIGGGSFMPHHSAAAFTSGLLPGDRPHRLKCHASRALGGGVRAGTTFVWMSGTPLSELSATIFGAPFYRFVRERGSLGRSPSIYDLDLRFAWEPPQWRHAPHPRFLLDAYHLGNPRRAVFIDQVHYHRVNASGQPVATNPNYLVPLLLQPPAAFRFGMELDW